MLIIGIAGLTLSESEREWLQEPHVSGVILFTRNFSSRAQVTELIDDIRMLRANPFLVCVDQEGGPVQRFREGFTALPALSHLGELYVREPRQAVELAEEHAWLMASEMRAIDVDISFAPVADLGRGNRAIGLRAFHADPNIVSELTLAYIRGMRLAGMAATVKHFPGHGSVAEDTHFEAATDSRSLEEIRAQDLIPFSDAIAAGAEAVMMAHVAYPQVDAHLAGYSRVWIQDVLRGELGFNGLVFSDDISMVAALTHSRVAARIAAHLMAGCDLVLACDPDQVGEAVKASAHATPCDGELLALLQGSVGQTWEALVDNPQRDSFVARVSALTDGKSSRA